MLECIRVMTGNTAACLAVATAIAVLSFTERAAADTDRRPNVLFIAVDDLNDWIGCLGGHPQAKTPNIDRLAEESALFAHAYAPATSCAPSRTAVLFGMAPYKSGVYGHDQVHKDGAELPRTQLPLNRIFQKNGYHTAGCGKIFHGGKGHKQGWDEYVQNFPGVKAKPLDLGPDVRLGGGIQETDDDRKTSDGQLTDWAIAQLERKHDKPFFIALGLRKPHLPWDAPKKYFDLYDPETIELPEVPDDDLDDLPPAGKVFARNAVGYGSIGDHGPVTATEGAWRRLVHAYLATSSFADANVGRILDALRKSPHHENTIVVLWGDHGWHLGEKHRWRKFALWERSTKTPLIIRVPGANSVGKTVDAPVGLQDVFPTLTELCGLKVTQPLDGNSLAPLLADPSSPWDKPVLMTHGPGNFAVRQGNWRLIHYADGSEELYDVRKDPAEFTNLAPDPKREGSRASLRQHLPKRWLYVLGPRFEAFESSFSRSPE